MLFHFIFLESLVEKDVRFFEFAIENALKAFKLLIFRFIIGILIVVPLIAIRAFFREGIILSTAILLFLVFSMALIMLVLEIVITDFTIPLMLFKNYGVVQSLKRIVGISSKRKELRQGAVYVIMRALISLFAGIIVLIISLFFLILFTIASGFIGFTFVGYIIIAFLLYPAIVDFLMMPIYAYIRLYSLIFLLNYEELGIKSKQK